MQKTPRSTHCILELYGYPSELLNDFSFVRGAVQGASQQGLSTLLDMSSHQFHPQGVTVVGLLTESHISIHTWPECGYVAVDVFTCGESADPQTTDQILKEKTTGQFKMLDGRTLLGLMQLPKNIRDAIAAETKIYTLKDPPKFFGKGVSS